MRFRIRIVIAAGAVVFAAVAPQVAGAQAPAALTAMDYIEIQQLVARYPYALDGGLGRGAVYADLFTADGVFINQDGRHDGGRAALERLGGARRDRETPLNTAHYIVNHVIEPLPGGRARGQEYLVVLDVGEEGPVHGPRPSSIRLGGQYRDEYEKTSRGWRFKSRQFINKDTTDKALAYAENLRHQAALTDLVRSLARERGLAVLATLHDLNQAARFADTIAILHEGRLHALGTPEETLRPDVLEPVYGVTVEVLRHPVTGVPLVAL